jgi:divalent metal cation (Fe/Co/Zn/Cd) transporter
LGLRYFPWAICSTHSQSDKVHGEMAGTTNTGASQDAVSQSRRVQIITIIWMGAEAALSLWAAWRASSPALLAFGGDSFIELFSAIVVLLRFAPGTDRERFERPAALIAGVLLFALALFVAWTSIVALLGRREPQTTRVGIAILISAAVFMPWLAKKKRSLAAVTGSTALKADAAESALCGYLALIALVGVLVRAVWHISWADPLAALGLLPFIVWEAWEAVKGKDE